MYKTIYNIYEAANLDTHIHLDLYLQSAVQGGFGVKSIILNLCPLKLAVNSWTELFDVNGFTDCT